MDPTRPDRILRQHLMTDRLLGVDAVPVGTTKTPVALNRPGTIAAETDASPLPSPPPVPSGGDLPKLQMLQALDENEVRGCTRCELHRNRTQTVFGEGDPDATVMFIGEGPGQSEDEQGRPFVGRAGEMLNKWIQAIGYEREQVYIANVVKCRPPGNRTPSAIEVDACSSFLRRQIETIQPQVIVTVGGPATKMVLDTQEGITRLRGRWRQYTGVNPPIPVMPTFHPAFLLRSYTKENRQKVWSDLQAVKERVAG